MKQLLITLLLLFFVLNCNLSGQAEKVGSDLRAIYRQLEGRSLEEAIAQLDQPLRSPVSAPGNVIIRMNGGGLENHVFIGERNTLEFLISHVDELSGMSLGFHFQSSFGRVDWIEDYGDAPLVNPYRRVVKVNSAEVPAIFRNVPDVQYMPDSILLGGVCVEAPPHIQPHTSPVLLFSMQFDVPAGASEVSAENGGFCLDNIFTPPAGTWTFTPRTTTAFAPDFQGDTNTSETIPDAPNVCFDVIHRQLCQTTFKNKSIVPVDVNNPELVYTPEQARSHHSVRIEPSGESMLRPFLVFTGQTTELKKLGVAITHGPFPGNILAVMFPVRLLPLVATVTGVESIYSQPLLEQK